MIFGTFAYYFAFLVPTVLAYRFLPRWLRPQILVVSGLAFFTYFAYTEMGGAAGAACLAIFVWEACFSRLYRPGSPLCLVGVAQAIAFLFVFKYWNFAVDSVAGGVSPLHWHGAFLPLGISFFTFEFIHYAIDRYRGRAERGGFLEYFAFIMFYPTMVAGPIKRFQDFLPKLQAAPGETVADWQAGMTRILAGLAKKFVVADTMTALTANLQAPIIEAAPRGLPLLWVLAYGVQIYFDFSAYSDIAIGSARLIGIRVPENFDWPYLSRNVAEFWRRWHISLSRWLFDYVFVPLGGSRVPLPRILANLMATMLVSGLWHGAAVNFVLWGAWHGALLAGHRLYRTANERSGGRLALPLPVAWAITFAAVNLGWAFFCMDVATAEVFFTHLLRG